mmetsp:Transcript_303/g.1178  ORF Transcript_303/g.1178 Transcript_303/m.1178 type:complete len:219 (-) Transcript_303:54-710(-)
MRYLTLRWLLDSGSAEATGGRDCGTVSSCTSSKTSSSATQFDSFVGLHAGSGSSRGACRGRVTGLNSATKSSSVSDAAPPSFSTASRARRPTNRPAVADFTRARGFGEGELSDTSRRAPGGTGAAGTAGDSSRKRTRRAGALSVPPAAAGGATGTSAANGSTCRGRVAAATRAEGPRAGGVSSSKLESVSLESDDVAISESLNCSASFTSTSRKLAEP